MLSWYLEYGCTLRLSCKEPTEYIPWLQPDDALDLKLGGEPAKAPALVTHDMVGQQQQPHSLFPFLRTLYPVASLFLHSPKNSKDGRIECFLVRTADARSLPSLFSLEEA